MRWHKARGRSVLNRAVRSDRNHDAGRLDKKLAYEAKRKAKQARQ